jgi:hypothetical protein
LSLAAIYEGASRTQAAVPAITPRLLARSRILKNLSRAGVPPVAVETAVVASILEESGR